MSYSYHVKSSDSGERLTRFLQNQLKEKYSGRQIKTLLERGALLCNGYPERYASRRVETGDKLWFDDHPLRLASVPRKLDVSWILYEDSDLCLLNKPWGWNTLPENKTVPAAEAQVSQAMGQTVYAVHRLDQETSGILLLVKKKNLRGYFQKVFAARDIEKRYIALVTGKLKCVEGEWVSYLAPVGRHQGIEKWGEVSRSRGKEAVTKYKVLRQISGGSLIELYPRTGRTHQLRVQLAARKCAIAGDGLYGESNPGCRVPSRLMLHAGGLDFPHPKQGKRIEIQAMPPDDFSAWLTLLERKKKGVS